MNARRTMGSLLVLALLIGLPVTSAVEATLHFPDTPVRAGLHYLDISVPIKTVEIKSTRQEK